MATVTAEWSRLDEEAERKKNWKRWGPYLAERQWATIREDYSPDGTCWEYLPHDHARSRAYRWGEDGLLGITDRQCRLCFALALWNEKDPILKERLIGLTGPEGNHGEDVKEEYFYIDATPTHSYLKALYNYPQAAFPYRELVAENRRRGPREPEYELADTGVFADNRYFGVMAEYAKAAPEDLLIRITVENHGPETAVLHLLPTIWFRNTWSWGCRSEGCTSKPNIIRHGSDLLCMTHETLGRFYLRIGPDPEGRMSPLLFTENETNMQRLYGVANASAGVKDGFHAYVVEDRSEKLNQHGAGTKAAPHYVLRLASGERQCIRLRLSHSKTARVEPTGAFEKVMYQRIGESDDFYATVLPEHLLAEARSVARQAYAGLLWSKQFYHYIIKEWLAGDPGKGLGAGHQTGWTALVVRCLESVGNTSKTRQRRQQDD